MKNARMSVTNVTSICSHFLKIPVHLRFFVLNFQSCWNASREFVEQVETSCCFTTEANSFISRSLVSFGHCSFMRWAQEYTAPSNLSNNQHAWCHVFDIGSKSTTVLQVGCTHNSRAVKVREPLATKVKVTLSKKSAS